MAYRPKARVPKSIPFKYDAATELYETVDDGVIYRLTYSQLNEMKTYFKHYAYLAKIGTWYESLDRFAKKKVQRINAPTTDNGFTPDQDWPD